MALLFKDLGKLSAYGDRRFPGTQEEYEDALQTSTAVYIGNLSFYTTEEQVYELFSRAGEVKKIIVGLDKNGKTQCGFCFVLQGSVAFTQSFRAAGTIKDVGRTRKILSSHLDKLGRKMDRLREDAVKYVSGTILDDHPIRVDYDWGFEEGRQWGRGRRGGQVRDEYRTDYDPDGRHGDRGGGNRRDRDDFQRKRAGEDEGFASEMSKRASDHESEKNPRFRESGDSDDDDEDDGRKRRR